jgi:hypothetical protein
MIGFDKVTPDLKGKDAADDGHEHEDGAPIEHIDQDRTKRRCDHGRHDHRHGEESDDAGGLFPVIEITNDRTGKHHARSSAG